MTDTTRAALEALESADWYIGQLEWIVYSPDDTGTHDARAKVQSAITSPLATGRGSRGMKRTSQCCGSWTN